MTTRRRDRFPSSRIAVGLLLSSLIVGPAVAQQGPTIEGAARECIPRVEFPMIRAEISPEGTVAQLYFRAATEQVYYFVAMRPTEAGYQAVLPMPEPQTREIVYYVEAIGPDGALTRTEEITARVVASEDECDEEALIYPADASIVVSSAAPGVPVVPPGFEAAGIAGGITRAGTPGWVWPVAIVGGLGLGYLILDELDDDDVTPTIP